MCGICGKLNFDRYHPVETGLIRAMMARIQHRGPDGAGDFVSGPVGLGHRRLSIIDLNTGTQPMSNEDGTVWVVYNGEIYNFKELRVELEQRGHIFKSATDTEVIVHLYEEMGDRCVERLQGMFAFAVWDGRRQRLLLARDRVGIKPLYYADTGRSLLFASEIKALLQDPTVGRRCEEAAVQKFLTYYYPAGPETAFQGIKKLEPGHTLSVESGRISIRRYWDLDFRPQGWNRHGSLETSADELRHLVAKSVQQHMISDVPVGVLLSGGLDSSTVLAHAARHANGPLHTFTVGFEGRGFADERPYARLVAARYGTVHRDMSMSAADFGDFLPRYVWHMEEPVCEPPAVALFFVAQLARRSGIKVLLSGEGGDEAFGGYPEYRNLLALEALKRMAGPFKGLLRQGFRALRAAGWQRGGHYAALVPMAARDYYFSRTSTPHAPFNALRPARSDAASTLAVDPWPSRTHWDSAEGLSLLNRMLYVDTKTWLPDDLLLKADKMTMATSVELRVPLLDPSILEFAASLPDAHKVGLFRLKRVLKLASRPDVPPEVLARKKTGFPVPYERWLRCELRELVFDTVLSRRSFACTFLPRRSVEQLLEANMQGASLSKEVFSLLVLNLWHEMFIGGVPSTRRAAASESMSGFPSTPQKLPSSLAL